MAYCDQYDSLLKRKEHVKNYGVNISTKHEEEVHVKRNDDNGLYWTSNCSYFHFTHHYYNRSVRAQSS